MKSTDLRIGNVLFYKITDPLDERKEWNEENMIDAQDIQLIHEALEPTNFSYIPLSIKYLLGAGFSNSNKKNIWVKTVHIDEETSYEFKIYISDSKFYFNFFIGGTSLSKQLEYLHELQNLFFVLTGQELLQPIET